MTPEQNNSPERITPEATIAREMDTLERNVESRVRALMGDDAYLAAKMFEQVSDEIREDESEEQRQQREAFEAKTFLESLDENPDIDSKNMPLSELFLLFTASRNDVTANPELSVYTDIRQEYEDKAAALLAEQLADYEVLSVGGEVCTLQYRATDDITVGVSFKKPTDGIEAELVVYLEDAVEDEGSLFGTRLRMDILAPEQYVEYGIDVSVLTPKVARALAYVNRSLAV